MTEDKAYETQRVAVEFVPDLRSAESGTYAAEARTLPEGYRDHLEDVLYGRCQAMSESEFEDKIRYSSTPVEEIAPTIQPAIPATSVAAAQEATVKVFNRRYLPAVIAFGLTVLAVVLTLLFTVPGTAWEKESIIIKSGSLTYTTQVAQAQTAPVNTIYVDGESKEVELQPYAKPTDEHTNWFDKLCDWLSGVVGG